MARGRLISKSLGSSRKFHALLQAGGKLGEFCQVLYPLLVANTDDYGRMPGDAFTVKNVVLPSSPRLEKDFDQALSIIASVGLIERYAISDTIYLQVNNFAEHQPGLKQSKVERYPAPSADLPEFREISGVPGNSALREEKGSKGKGREGNLEPRIAREADALFESFWAAYPKKKDREAAKRAWDKRRPDSDLLAVMLRALERQQSSPDWQKESGRYIPFPATWINRARWTDEVDVDLEQGGLSETARYNLGGDEEYRRILEQREQQRVAHGPTRQH